MSNAHISQEQWSLVGGDPTPGDPDGIAAKANVYKTIADNASNCHDSILQLSSASPESWQGKAAAECRTQLERQAKLPADLVKLEASYTLASDALQKYAARLRELQQEASREVSKAVTAQGDEDTAKPKVQQGSNNVSTLKADIATLQQYIAKLRGLMATPAYSDPANASYKAQVDSNYYDALSDLNDRNNRLADANRQLNSAQGSLNDARGRLQDARNRVRALRSDRDDTVRQTVDDIEEASKAGIQNKKWWQKIGDWVAAHWVDVLDWISKNIDKLVLALAIVIAVVAIVAAPFTGGSSLSLLGVAFKVYMVGSKVAAVIKLACDLVLVSQGRRTWGDVAVGAVFTALAFAGGKGSSGALKAGKGGVKGAIAKFLQPITKPIQRVKQLSEFVPKKLVRTALRNPVVNKVVTHLDDAVRPFIPKGPGYKYTKHILEKEAVKFWKGHVQKPIQHAVTEHVRHELEELRTRPMLDDRYRQCLRPTVGDPAPVGAGSGGGGGGGGTW